MPTNSLKIATLIAAGALLGAAPALALDGKVVLDQLVKKGVLTPEEADAIIRKENDKLRNDPIPATAQTKEIDTKKITVSGKVQVQSKVVATNDRTGNKHDNVASGFELRRMDIAVEGEIADSFRAVVDYRAETATGAPGNTIQNDAGFQVDKSFVEYDTKGYGLFLMGMKKAPLGYEEYTSSSYILPIERGIVNNYFVGNAINSAGTNLCLGERRMGLYYDTQITKKIEKEGGTKFGLAATNDVRRRFDKSSGDLAYYANAMHVSKVDDTTFIDFGVNTSYTGSEQQRKLTTGVESKGIQSYVAEAYTRIRLGEFALLLESYHAWIENGRLAPGGRADTAKPEGFIAMASYKIDDAFEPVVSFNYLDTHGRGVQPGDVIRDAASFGVADRAISLYSGMNWYITPSKSMKLSLGMEATRFEGAERTKTAPVKTDVLGGRMQVQALF